MNALSDPETDYWNGQFVDIEQMSGQWLGATVISTPSHPNGALMVSVSELYPTLNTLLCMREQPHQRDCVDKATKSTKHLP